jgi:hypothetical protein
MQKVSNKKETGSSLQYLLTFILISLQLLYPLKQLVPNIVQIPIFYLWVILLYPKMRCFKEIFFSKTIGLFVIFLSIIFRVVLSRNFGMGFFDPLQLLIAFYQFIVTYCLYLYIKELSDIKIKKIVVFSLVCIFISLLFSLYYVFFVDPQAIRNTMRGFLWGVGDFELMYSVVLLIGCLIGVLKTKLKPKTAIKLTILLLTCVITILKSNLVTSVVLSVIAIILTLIMTSKRPKANMSIATIIFLGLYMIKAKVAWIFITIASWNLFYWSTQNKILAIGNLLRGSGDIDTLIGRSILRKQSIDSFLANPVFGINYSNYGQGVIGNHAQWADDLARHGIVGFTFIVIVFCFIFSNILKHTKHKVDKINVVMVWILYIILGFLNPNMMGAVLMVLFLIAPFLSLLQDKE